MTLSMYRPTPELFGSLFEDVLGSAWGRITGGEVLGTPAMDVVEDADAIRVTVELPGMTPADLDVHLENNRLTISGEKKEAPQTERGLRWHVAERRYGRFTRSLVLPRDVEQDGVEARFENGVLDLRIPKSEKSKPRRIEIRNGGGRRRLLSGASK